MTTWVLFAAVAAVILIAGVPLARYGDVLGEKTGLGASWIGLILLSTTTSLPELFAGFSATALAHAPDLAIGDVLGSCMFNLVILSLMDVVQPEPLSARAHQGHALSIGFALLLVGIGGLGLLAGHRMPVVGWVGLYAPVMLVVYALGMRLLFQHERRRRAEAAEELPQYEGITTRTAVQRYGAAAVVVVMAALWLPQLGVRVAEESGLGQAFVGSMLIALSTSLPEVVVSLTAVRMGALDLGIGNVLGSNLFNMAILALDDLFYTDGALLAGAGASHSVTLIAIVMMNALFLIGLTYQVMRKRFRVSWDTGAIAAVYVVTAVLVYLMRD